MIQLNLNNFLAKGFFVKKNKTKKTFLFKSIAIFGVLLIFMGAQNGFAQTRCLDYWSAGPAKCKKSEPERPKKDPRAQEQPTAEFIDPEDPLEEEEEEMTEEEKKEAQTKEKVEKFYTRHGKPPEEFVRFYMDPTPGNAIAWVKKYNEELKRSRQLSEAWTQAQKIYDEFDAQGMEIPPELLPEYARNEENQLPPVQDLGLELPPGMEGIFGGTGQPKNPFKTQEPSENQGGLGGGQFSVQISEDGRIGGNLPPQALTNSPVSPDKSSNARENRFDVQGDAGGMEISYYFSAECPYCEKFEPGFRKVLEDMDENTRVTCVDMTPSGQTQANIHGKLDCEWRPLMAGEMKAMGVEATPTLIVDRGNNKPLERLSGFVDEARLRSYLMGN